MSCGAQRTASAPHPQEDIVASPQPPIVPGPDEPYRLGDVMPARHRRRGGLVVGLAVAVAAVTLAGAAAALVLAGDEEEPAGASPTSTCTIAVDASTGAVVCASPGAAPVINEQPNWATPRVADFKVIVKILEKKCFGSAGCIVTYRIEPAYTGAPLDPAVTWLVTYEVRGAEDGPQINNFEVRGDEVTYDSEETADTPSSKTKLTARVTEVLPG